jgi:hypothetical protein
VSGRLPDPEIFCMCPPAPYEVACHCFQYQTWCDCRAGREWEATRIRLAKGPRDIYLAFLRGERDA